MFTGIVEEVGQVSATRFDQEHPQLLVGCEVVLAGLRQGDSIAVDGVCLTVERFDERGFTAGLMPETLRRSALGRLQPGAPVNLERSLAANGRIGGHFVQGHVDGTGTVAARHPDGAALVVTIAVPPSLARYIVEKGYLAVDGASLTVVEARPDACTVSLVQHTQEHSTLAGKQVGEPVNLEVDILAKYVERFSGAPGQAAPVERGAANAAGDD